MNTGAMPGHNGDHSRRYGATVTFERQEDGELLTRAKLNTPATQAVADLCDEVEWLSGTWKVVSISTPQSIWTDLQGTRDRTRTPGGSHSDAGHYTQFPEAMLLSRIGRPELWKPPTRFAQDPDGPGGKRTAAPSFAPLLKSSAGNWNGDRHKL